MSTPATAAPVGRTRAALVTLFGSYVLSALSIVKGIVFVPWYLHVLGVDAYGAWVASGTVVSMLGVLDAGISNITYQRLSEAWGAGDQPRFLRTLGAGSVVLGIVSALIAIGGSVIAPLVPKLVHAPEDTRTALVLAVVLASFASAISVTGSNLLAVSAAWQRNEIGVAARISGQLAETVLIAIGLLMGWGVIALGIGAVVGAVTTLAVGALWTGARWRGTMTGRPVVRTSELRSFAREAGAFMLARIILTIDANIEVPLVANILGPSAAAIYAITDRILRTAMSFINPIAGSLISGLAHFVGEQGRRQALRPARELVAVWSLIIAATLPPLLAMNHDFTVLWVGARNYGGWGLNVALCASELLGGREQVFSVILMASGAVVTCAWVTTLEAVVRMPIMLLALLHFGWVGLPSAQAAVSAVTLGVYAVQVGRQLHASGDESRALGLHGLLVVCVSFALALVEARWWPAATSWRGLVLKASLIGAIHLAMAWGMAKSGREVLVKRLLARRQRAGT